MALINTVTPAVCLEQRERERGVNQMLTDDPPARHAAPTKEASDGWQFEITLFACLYIRIVISQHFLSPQYTATSFLGF